MRKKEGKSFTLYLPKNMMDKARVLADERDKSTSFIVACALRDYLGKPKDNAPAVVAAEAPRA